MTEQENVHIANRDHLVNFLKADIAGPSTISSFIEFEELDTSEEVVFNEIEDSWKCFKDASTGEEILTITPKRSYSAGIIYPRNSNIEEEGVDEEAGELDLDISELSDENTEDYKNNIDDIKERKRSSRKKNYNSTFEDNDETEVIKLTNQRKPSSIALSFRFSISKKDSFKVLISGATYEPFEVYRGWSGDKEDDEKKKSENGNTFYKTFYKRNPLSEEVEINADEILKIKKEGFISDSLIQHEECEFKLKTYIRKFEESFIATVMLINENEGYDNTNSLFQSKIEIKVNDQEGKSLLMPLPENIDSIKNKLEVNEENIFSFIYQKLKTFAVGHGISVNWSGDDASVNPESIFTEFVPSHDIQPITPDIINDKTGKQFEISMEELSRGEGFEKIEDLLKQYDNWIKKLEDKEEEIKKNSNKFIDIYMHNVELCRESLNRMQEGYKILLEENDQNIAKKAFMLANKALYLQQKIPTERREAIFREEGLGISFQDHDEWLDEINNTGNYSNKGSWRPFQIGFILLTLESIVNPESDHRETVDLLWFPTGGGKTEAYLGISAFLLFYTRLTNKDDDGVQILMRYTLRLLTAQQFERASKLIVCMEQIRRKEELLQDQKEFSIGIWVGGSVTPNKKDGSIKSYEEIIKSGNYQAEKKYKFILQACPWCRAEIGVVPWTRIAELKQYKIQHRINGLREKNGLIELLCPDPNCEFKNGLPVYVIDEEIYEKKPSLIISTVDKFAQLIWKPEARGLFGLDNEGNQIKPPPSLVIQDELHLISNALGSAVGFFESIINHFLTYKIDNKKMIPKIICSTATIKNSANQILGLYAREKSSIFPAVGIDISDSFFSKEDKNGNGKKFLGLYLPVFSTQQAQAVVLSNLVQGPSFLSEEERDPWWTNLNYFHSIRELGTTWSIYHEDVKRRLKLLHKRFQIGENRAYKPKESQINELTSRISSTEVVDAMNKMQIKSSEKGVLRAVLATSIVEVGVDIQRLSLLTILGQPKNTAQYIQVGGRVGRSKASGLVLTIFGPGRPRDTSHYEKFRSYHQRLYSAVEPTSVTPFSRPAIDRYISGAFFMYLTMKLNPNKFKNFDLEPFPTEEFENFKQIMISRGEEVKINNLEKDFLNDAINKIKSKWENSGALIWSITHDSRITEAEVPLLTHQGSFAANFHTPSFSAPDSMRSVELTSRPKIVNPSGENNDR